MRLLIPAISILLIMTFVSSVIADETKLKSHSSDMVGVKVEYPSDWYVEDYSWGFTLNDPVTTASITFQVYFMPAEMNEAYDVNFNPVFSKVYGKFFESVDEGEKRISGMIWDYVISNGSIGTPLEYFEVSYSLLIENTVYSIQLYNPKGIDDESFAELKAVIDTVKLMYRESELPLIREYKKELEKAKEKGESLEFAIPTGDVTVEYLSPWMFTGTGSNTEASFHYLSGDPYLDIDMILIKLDNKDAKLATVVLQGILASLTAPYSSEKDDEATFNREKYFVKLLTQGQDEDVLHTRFYSTLHNDESIIIIFAYHEKAHESADEIISEFMKGVSLK